MTENKTPVDSRLELVLDATRVGLWEWEITSGWVSFNQHWAEMVGYTLEELAPLSIQTWTDLVHSADLIRSKKLLDQHFSGEFSHYECECRMRHKDGHWVWVMDRGKVVVRADDGSPLRMTGTHVDITALKMAELNERQSHENFEALFNTIKDFLFVLDEQGCILHVNDTVVQRLGYSLEELKGRSIFSVHPAERRVEAEIIVQAMLAGDVDFCPIPLISRSGTLIPVETCVSSGCGTGMRFFLASARTLQNANKPRMRSVCANPTFPRLLKISRVTFGLKMQRAAFWL